MEKDEDDVEYNEISDENTESLHYKQDDASKQAKLSTIVCKKKKLAKKPRKDLSKKEYLQMKQEEIS
jgi:hypothetical protein